MRQTGLVALLVAGLALGACATTGLQFAPEGGPHPTRGTPEQIQVFSPGDAPIGRSFVRVGTITWDYTEKKFVLPQLRDALPAVKQKAWEAGGDAVVLRQAQFTGQPAADKPLHIRGDVTRWQP